MVLVIGRRAQVVANDASYSCFVKKDFSQHLHLVELLFVDWVF